MATREELAFLAGKGRLVHQESHRDGRFVNLERWQRFRVLPVADGVRDEEFVDATEDHDVTSACLLYLVAIQAEEAEQLRELARADLAVGTHDADVGSGRRPPAGDRPIPSIPR